MSVPFTRSLMKRIAAIAAAVMILMLCVLPAAAAADSGAPADTGVQLTSAGGESATELQEGIFQEDDMVIDLNLTTTLIIVVCSVLTVGILAVAVFLCRRNRG